MSRRKQANPKSIKDALESKLINSNNNNNIETRNDVGMTLEEKQKEQKIIDQVGPSEMDNVDEDEERIVILNVGKEEDDDDEEASRSSTVLSQLDDHHDENDEKYNENNDECNDNDIDVENLSDEETEISKEYDEIDNENEVNVKDLNSPSSTKENNINSWPFNGSPSASPAPSTASSSAPSTVSSNNSSKHLNSKKQRSNKEKLTLKTKHNNNLNHEDDNSNENEINHLKNGNDKKTLYSTNTCTTNNQQRSAPIVVNGKKYYPLLFNCPDCGVRYSDKGTLMTHQQNYCSKRLINDNKESTTIKSTTNSNNEVNKNVNITENDKNSVPSLTRSPSINESTVEVKSNDINETNSKQIENDAYLNTKLQNIEQNEFIKTEIYQCNHCTFTTDKKFTMNKHSRVHLPQKRKAMEELNNTSNKEDERHLNAKLFKSNDDDDSESTKHDNEKQIETKLQTASAMARNQAYCHECEIQFSSMKTFIHHKTHYCQKYKTIEAIVPQNAINNNNIHQIIQSKPTSSDSMANIQKNDFKSNPNDLNKVKQTTSNKTSPSSSKSQSPNPTEINEQNLLTIQSQQKNIEDLIKLYTNEKLKQNVALPFNKEMMLSMMAKNEYNNEHQTKLATNKISLVSPASSPLSHFPLAPIPIQSSNTNPTIPGGGEVVYVPVYIPKNSKNNSEKTSQLPPPPPPPQFPIYRPKMPSIPSNPISIALPPRPGIPILYPHNSIRQQMIPISNDTLANAALQNLNTNSTFLPLDLRLNEAQKKDKTQSLNNTPLDLSIKSKDTKKTNDASVQSKFSCEACNMKFQTNEHFTFHKLSSECVLNNKKQVNIKDTSRDSNENELNQKQFNNNNSYYCKFCKQTFNNLKLFRFHACKNGVNTDDLKVYFQCKLCSNQPYFATQENYIDHLNQIHQNETVFVKQNTTTTTTATVNTPKSPSPPVTQMPVSLLTYQTQQQQQPVKRYYVCKTCGYRGNTIRGVRQHGKLHISNNEPFDILDANLEEIEKIKLINSSHSNKANNCSIKEIDNLITPINNNETFNTFNSNNNSNNRILISECMDSNNSDEKFDKQIRKRTYSISNNNENDDDNYDDNNNECRNKRSCVNDNDNNDDYCGDDDSNSNNSNSKNALIQSQTYCTTCNIQFQQEHNFSAHKKFYCKESSSNSVN